MPDFNENYAAELLEKRQFVELTNYLQQCPQTAPVLTFHGNMLLLQEKYDDAVLVLKKAIELDPKSAIIWNNLGLAYFHSELLDEALKAYDTALELDENYIEAMINAGTAYLSVNQLEEARKCFEGGLKLDPLNDALWANLGAAFMFQKEFGNAKVCFLRALSLKESENAYYNLGVVEVSLGDKKNAQKHLAAAITMNKLNYNAILALSEVLFDSKDFIQALDHTIEGLQHESLPKKVKVNFLILQGKIFFHLSKWKDYRTAFEEAIALDEGYTSALEYAQRLATQNLDQAIEILQTALPRHENAEDLLFALAVTDLKKFNNTFDIAVLEQSQELFNKILKINPGNANAMYNLGIICQLQGKDQEADTWIDKALKINPLIKKQLLK